LTRQGACLFPMVLRSDLLRVIRRCSRRSNGLENFILNVGHIGHERRMFFPLSKRWEEFSTHRLSSDVLSGVRMATPACRRQKSTNSLAHRWLDHDSEVLASAYAACDVFVLPSLFETPGIAALEAGLAGAKVVITDHGGPHEYFGNMATYVDPRSVDRIEGGVRSALQEKKTERLREHIRKEYLWSAIARRLPHCIGSTWRTTPDLMNSGFPIDSRYPRPSHFPPLRKSVIRAARVWSSHESPLSV
jgi:glycosyltransferase involved in cell wall biosynthesis